MFKKCFRGSSVPGSADDLENPLKKEIKRLIFVLSFQTHSDQQEKRTIVQTREGRGEIHADRKMRYQSGDDENEDIRTDFTIYGVVKTFSQSE